MAKVKKFLNIVVSAVLVCALLLGSAYTGVFAADQQQTYTIKDLYDRGKAKLVGRTEFVNGNLLTEWASSGFELSVTAPAGGADLTLNTYYEIFSYHYVKKRFGDFSPVKIYEDIIIDDEDKNPVLRKQGSAYGYDFRMKAYPTELDSKGDKDLFDIETTKLTTTLQTNFSVTRHIPEGTHTVRIIRDSGPDKYHNYTHQYVSVKTSATINDKPADKPLYIDCIGDSYGTGSGTLNPYYTKAGIGGGSEAASSSIVNSYAYVVARQLGADLSIESMGGYGVLGNTGASVEDVSSGTSMLDIYPYADAENAFRKEGTVEKYVQTRRPDLVVIALGSNDGQVYMDGAVDKEGNKHKSWKAEADRLIKMARTYTKDGKLVENDTTIPVVWMTTGTSTTYKQYMFMLKAKMGKTTYTDEEGSSHDIEKIENLHPLRLYVGGNGGVALGTQESGHMSADQEQQMGKYLANFMIAEKIAPDPNAQAEDFYMQRKTVVEAYVDGVSGGTGTEQSPFTYISDAEKYLSTEVKKISGNNDNVEARIHVMNKQETVLSSAAANGNSLTGCTDEVKTSDGNLITVQIIGYDSEESGVKPWMIAANGGSKSFGWRRMYNSYCFKDIKITGAGGTGVQGGNELGLFSAIYTFGYDVTFDYGTEIYDSTTSSKQGTSFTTLNGSTASNSSEISTKADANGRAGKITVNSGKFGTINVAGIAGNGAYSPSKTTTSYADMVYDVYTSKHTFAIEVNGGEITTLEGGSNSMISGKNTEISYEINGGYIKNMRAGAVYNADKLVCRTQHADFNITVNGGQIDNYIGLTGSATSANPYIYKGNYNFTMNGGTIGTSGTKEFKTTESYVTVQNITNTINEGHIYVEPKAVPSGTYSYNGVYFGGYTGTVVNGKITNNINGGEIMSRYSSGVAAYVSMGGLWDIKAPEITNNITGGRFMFYPLDETNYGTANTSSGVYMGGVRSKIDVVNNNISGGLFDANPTGGLFQYNMGCGDYSKGYTCWIGKINNVIGVEGKDLSPVFMGGMAYMGGSSQSGGEKAKELKSGEKLEVIAENMSDEVVVSNIIHGFYITGSTILGPAFCGDTTRTMNTAGSVETVIDSGLFMNSLYCGGGQVYGHTKTTINGGYFKNVYSYGSSYEAARVYDGSELIINGADASNTNPFIKQGFKTYSIISSADNFNVYGGSNKATVVAPITSGRPALKLTVNGGTFSSNTNDKNVEHGCKIFGGSANATVSGDIENTVTGGMVNYFYYGGNENGTVSNCKITNNLSGVTTKKDVTCGSAAGTMSNVDIVNNLGSKLNVTNQNFYGSMNAGTFTGGTVTNNFNGGYYQYRVYAGCGAASFSGSVVNNIDFAGETGTSGAGFSGAFIPGGSAKATSFAGNVVTNIKSKVNADTFKNQLFTGSLGDMTGDATVNIETGTGATIYETVIGSETAGKVQTGNVQINAKGAHIGNIKTGAGTVSGTKDVNIDISKTTVFNGKVGTSDMGEYKVNLIGGAGGILLSDNAGKKQVPNLEFDTVDSGTGKLAFTYYSSVTVGQTYVKLPGTVDRTRVSTTKKTATTSNFLLPCFDGTNLKLIGHAKEEHDYETEWSKDASNHWHVCKDCSDKFIEAHKFGQGNICSVCAYELEATIGDLDGDGFITDADAVYLLMHVYFPQIYPTTQQLDYNGDGNVTDDDAVYLLMHVYFPQIYPLEK